MKSTFQKCISLHDRDFPMNSLSLDRYFFFLLKPDVLELIVSTPVSENNFKAKQKTWSR